MSQRPSKTENLRVLLQQQRVLVCCGAGGVGKTTSAAALALSAARLGRKTLVLTIDPSKRLAETLSISRDAPAPTALSIPAFEALGLPSEQLSAWVLDPKQVSDRVVFERSGARATRLLTNPIYQGVSAMVAGMQEYTAIEALHRFIGDARYELIILDTPPSRHALRFLDAPTRVQRFLDRRIFQLFLPQRGLIGRVAGRINAEVLDPAFGPAVNPQLRELFEDFSPILA
ncbi:MAG: ArsA-related P-loop ATPase, partial [Myxococcota bacterium]|nr:ArsA-related P-loop ATPase [Myxococcota bacterium]